MSDPVIHVVTGEVLPDDIETLAALEKNVDHFLRSLGVHYSFRRRLRERLAELRGEYPVPPPRYRTEKQQRVSECVRCGAKPTPKSPPSESEDLEDDEHGAFLPPEERAT